VSSYGRKAERKKLVKSLKVKAQSPLEVFAAFDLFKTLDRYGHCATPTYFPSISHFAAMLMAEKLRLK
jgi:hypothetical protein